MPDANFNIYFTDDGATGNAANPSPADNPVPEQNNPAQAKGGAKQLAALATLSQIGKTAMSFAAGHVETYTGSSRAQEQVNSVIGIAGTIGAIAVNPALGIAMTAMNLATKALDYANKKKWDNIAVAEAQRRAGPSFNRSRK